MRAHRIGRSRRGSVCDPRPGPCPAGFGALGILAAQPEDRRCRAPRRMAHDGAMGRPREALSLSGSLWWAMLIGASLVVDRRGLVAGAGALVFRSGAPAPTRPCVPHASLRERTILCNRAGPNPLESCRPVAQSLPAGPRALNLTLPKLWSIVSH